MKDLQVVMTMKPSFLHFLLVTKAKYILPYDCQGHIRLEPRRASTVTWWPRWSTVSWTAVRGRGTTSSRGRPTLSATVACRPRTRRVSGQTSASWRDGAYCPWGSTASSTKSSRSSTPGRSASSTRCQRKWPLYPQRIKQVSLVSASFWSTW